MSLSNLFELFINLNVGEKKYLLPTSKENPADHAGQQNSKERQDLQIRRQQWASFGMCECFGRQGALHDHLQTNTTIKSSSSQGSKVNE